MGYSGDIDGEWDFNDINGGFLTMEGPGKGIQQQKMGEEHPIYGKPK